MKITQNERKRLVLLRLRVASYVDDGFNMITHRETHNTCFYKLQHERNHSMLVIHASLDNDVMQEIHDGKSTISNIHA